MYTSKLDLLETEKAIKIIKDTFQGYLSKKMVRVSAPKFIRMGTGIQDDLAGTCSSVQFYVPNLSQNLEIVHSLAKWKRLALSRYKIPCGQGLYTDMDAIRKDEVLDEIHSIYVDQWDWEIHISENQRNLSFLKEIVNHIYDYIYQTKKYLVSLYPQLTMDLPKNITFIHSENLYQLYPFLDSKEREAKVCQKFGAVFLIGIGYPLLDGKPHDTRANDYDDWSTETSPDIHGLNGDILVWDAVRQDAIELSSMGIRVNKESLITQMKEPLQEYHHLILEGKIPQSIGGGIGQSRLCQFLLEKKHIGEVQVSEWTPEIYEQCAKEGILLL